MSVIRQVVGSEQVLSSAVLPSLSWFETHSSTSERKFVRLLRAVRQFFSFQNHYLKNKRFRRLMSQREIRSVFQAFNRLDLNYLIGTRLYDRFLNLGLLLSKHSRELIDKPFELPDWIKDFLSRMARSLRASRASVNRSRVQLEIFDAFLKKRFVLFETLTAEAGKEFSFYPNSVEWKSFQKRWRRALADVGCKYHSYYCVPELGGKNGRLHYHVLRVVDKLPAGFRDPCRFDGSWHREIDVVKDWWHCGLYSVVPVRWADDGFSRMKWRWPIDKQGNPIESNLFALSCYLGKYITKRYRQFSQSLNKEILCKLRTKMSRGFGLNLVDLSVEKATVNQLKVLMEIPVCRESVKGIPHLPLLRLRAKRQLVLRSCKDWRVSGGVERLSGSFQVLRSIPSLRNEWLKLVQADQMSHWLSSGRLILDPVPVEQYDRLISVWSSVSLAWRRCLRSVGGRHAFVGSVPGV